MSNAQTQPPQRPTNAGQLVAARKDLLSYFETPAVKTRVSMAVPRGADAEWLLATFRLALHQNPRLQQCTQVSLYAALMKCASMGLAPDGRGVYLIPFSDQVQVITGWMGLLDLCYRSGEVSSVFGAVVYEADDFEYSEGTDGRLHYQPNLRSKERGEAYCAFSYVIRKDQTPSSCVMRRDEIEAIRDGSQGWIAFIDGKAKQSPWDPTKHAWSEMWKKTVFRRHSKLLPFSPQLRTKLESDDEPLPSDEARFAEAKKIHVAPTRSFLGPGPEDNGPAVAPIEAEQKPRGKRKAEPEQPSTPTDIPAEVTPADDAALYYAELGRIIKKQGVTFSWFADLCERADFVPNATSYGSLEEFPLESVKSLLKSGQVLITAIEAAKPKAKENLI